MAKAKSILDIPDPEAKRPVGRGSILDIPDPEKTVVASPAVLPQSQYGGLKVMNTANQPAKVALTAKEADPGPPANWSEALGNWLVHTRAGRNVAEVANPVVQVESLGKAPNFAENLPPPQTPREAYERQGSKMVGNLASVAVPSVPQLLGGGVTRAIGGLPGVVAGIPTFMYSAGMSPEDAVRAPKQMIEDVAAAPFRVAQAQQQPDQIDRITATGEALQPVSMLALPAVLSRAGKGGKAVIDETRTPPFIEKPKTIPAAEPTAKTPLDVLGLAKSELIPEGNRPAEVVSSPPPPVAIPATPEQQAVVAKNPDAYAPPVQQSTTSTPIEPDLSQGRPVGVTNESVAANPPVVANLPIGTVPTGMDQLAGRAGEQTRTAGLPDSETGNRGGRTSEKDGLSQDSETSQGSPVRVPLSRSEYEARGTPVLPDNHPLMLGVQNARNNLDRAAAEVMSRVPTMRDNSAKLGLKGRKATFGAALQFTPQTIETALRSNRVPREAKQAYYEAKSRYDSAVNAVDDAVSYDAYIRNLKGRPATAAPDSIAATPPTEGAIRGKAEEKGPQGLLSKTTTPGAEQPTATPAPGSPKQRESRAAAERAILAIHDRAGDIISGESPDSYRQDTGVGDQSTAAAPMYDFNDTPQGRSWAKEVRDRLPKNLQMNVRVRKGQTTGVSAEDSGIQPEQMAANIQRFADSGKTGKIRKTVDFVLKNPEQFSPDEVYAVQKWRAFQDRETAQQAKGKTPQNVPVASLGVGDKMTIAGEPFKVSSKSGGMVTVEDGITLEFPEGADVAVDKGSLKQRPPEQAATRDLLGNQVVTRATGQQKKMLFGGEDVTMKEQKPYVYEKPPADSTEAQIRSQYDEAATTPFDFELDKLADKPRRPPPDSGAMPGMQFAGGAVDRAIGEVGKLAHEAVTELVDSNTLTSAPRTTRAAREVGEKLVQAGSARETAIPLGKYLASKVLEGATPDQVEKVGAAFVEEQLRGTRKQRLAEADRMTTEALDLRRQGKTEAADAIDEQIKQARDAAEKVGTIIGREGSPFKNEADYQAALKDPALRKYFDLHKQHVQPVLDQLHKTAGRMADEEVLFNRSPDIGFQHLKGMNPDETMPGEKPIRVTSGGGVPFYRQKSAFFKRASGTGTYDLNYENQVTHGIAKELFPARKNELYDLAVKNGVGKIMDTPTAQIEINGERAAPIDIAPRRGQKPEYLYVPESMKAEWERALKRPEEIVPRWVNKLQRGVTFAGLAGIAEAVMHGTNIENTLMNSPGMSSKAKEASAALGGPLNLIQTNIELVRVAREIKAGGTKILKEQAELANMGAGRRPIPEMPGVLKHLIIGGKILKPMDAAARVIMLRRGKMLQEKGIIPKTETALREYVNQLGQYNDAFAPWYVRMAKRAGVGPFATAGYTMTRNAIRRTMPFLSSVPGPVEGVSGAAKLKAMTYGRAVGWAAWIGGINYATTGKASGRPGTPMGYIDTGKDDERGRPIWIPAIDIAGFGRGLRATGITGTVRGRQAGKDWPGAVTEGAYDAIDAATRPMIGPPARAIFTAATGYDPSVRMRRASHPVPADKSQLAENIKESLQGINPLLENVTDETGIPPWLRIASGIAPGFIREGKTEKQQKDSAAAERYVRARDYLASEASSIKKRYQGDIRAATKELTERFRELPLDDQRRLYGEYKRHMRGIGYAAREAVGSK